MRAAYLFSNDVNQRDDQMEARAGAVTISTLALLRSLCRACCLQKGSFLSARVGQVTVSPCLETLLPSG